MSSTGIVIGTLSLMSLASIESASNPPQPFYNGEGLRILAFCQTTSPRWTRRIAAFSRAEFWPFFLLHLFLFGRLSVIPRRFGTNVFAGASGESSPLTAAI
jgi:hypothetical protein